MASTSARCANAHRHGATLRMFFGPHKWWLRICSKEHWLSLKMLLCGSLSRRTSQESLRAYPSSTHLSFKSLPDRHGGKPPNLWGQTPMYRVPIQDRSRQHHCTDCIETNFFMSWKRFLDSYNLLVPTPKSASFQCPGRTSSISPRGTTRAWCRWYQEGASYRCCQCFSTRGRVLGTLTLEFRFKWNLCWCVMMTDIPFLTVSTDFVSYFKHI